MYSKSFFYILLMSLYSCSPYNYSYSNSQKNEINQLCKECKEYVIKELRPQIEKCRGYRKKNTIYTEEDCNFNRNRLHEMTNCFIGKRKEQMEQILGTTISYFYRKTHSGSGGVYLSPEYSLLEKRVIRLNIGGYEKSKILSCIDCQALYKSIKTKKRLKATNISELLDKYGSCLINLYKDNLNNLLDVNNYQELKNYQGKFTKTLNFKGREVKVEFLYAPGYTLESANEIE